MRLEQWSHIRNAVKEQCNAVARDLDKMESFSNDYDEMISEYPKYNEAVILFIRYENIIKHMDCGLSVSEIEQIDY